MELVVLFLVLQLVINKRIRPSDYCFGRQACTGEHQYSCLSGLCSKDTFSCQPLKLWHSIAHKNTTAEKYFKQYAKLINKCPPWNPNDVCLNDAVCFDDVHIPQRMAMNGKWTVRKQTKCLCSGKHRYSCGKEQKYCTTDKGACDRMNITFLANFKNCKI